MGVSLADINEVLVLPLLTGTVDSVNVEVFEVGEESLLVALSDIELFVVLVEEAKLGDADRLYL